VLTKGLNDVYKYSSIDYDVSWDGIACQDSEYKLFFEADNSHTISDFQFMRQKAGTNVYTQNIGESHDDITVELWFRPSDYRRTSHRHYLVTLIKNGRTFFTIMQTTSGQLACLPLYDKHQDNLKYGLRYFDYSLNSDAEEVWHHVSCTVDSKNKVIIGTLFQQKNDGNYAENGYLKNTTDFTNKFRIGQDRNWDKFQVQLNGNIGKRQGMPRTYYADVRVWKEARTWNQIKDNRQVLLDYHEHRGKMISSVQYLGGGRSGSAEPDLAQMRDGYLNIAANTQGYNPISSFVKFSGQQWKADVDNTKRNHKRLILCPRGTYPNWERTSCSKQGLLDVRIFAMKDTKRGIYEITAAHSIVQNQRVSDHINTLFEFKWTLRQVVPKNDYDHIREFPNYLKPQASKSSLKFNFKDVQDQAYYWFSLQVDDLKFKMLDGWKDEYWFQASECIQFYDKETNDTTVTKVLRVEKAQENLYLNYVLKGCDRLQPSQAVMSFLFLDEGYARAKSFGYRFEIPLQRFLISK